MGTDIHGRVQAKYSNESTEWHDVCEVEDSRNYALFTALCGVRTYPNVSRISDPRGYPEDFHRTADGDDILLNSGYDNEVAYWMGDHSHSWLDLDEVVNWDGWDQRLRLNTLREQCAVFLAHCHWLKLKYKNSPVRLVFGFDS